MSHFLSRASIDKKKKRKEKEKNINNNLAVLPSHDKPLLRYFSRTDWTYFPGKV